MKTRSIVPAPAYESAALLLGLTRFEQFTNSLLDDIRWMLQMYPARTVAKALEEASCLVCEEGGSPEWPDNGEMNAYMALLTGLWELASIEERLLTAAA